MSVYFLRRFGGVLIGCAAVGLAACQGNLGSSGLSIPQGGTYGQPGGPGQAGVYGPNSASRQRTVDGAVSLSADRKEIPLPTVDGFSVTLDVTSLAIVAPNASGTLTRTTTGSGSPEPQPSPAPSVAVTGSPSAGGTAKPGAGSPAPSPSPQASSGPSKHASPAPKIVTKTIVYPDDAPAPPSPEPSGDVQTFFKRTAIVRGYIESPADITVAGASALHFTITKSEQLTGRGFTIAIYQTGKKHHERLLADDSNAVLSNNIVGASENDPLVLKKDQGYLLMLYGDEVPATPGPYPSAGNNPLPLPSGYTTAVPGQPGAPGQYPPGQQPPTVPPGYATPIPQPTFAPH